MSRKNRGYIVVMHAALCLLSMNSCSEGVESPRWDVHEKYQFKPIRKGVYKVELVIHKDECEPSLDEVIRSQVDWPPKEQVISFDVSEEYPHDILSPPLMFLYGVEIRTGQEFDIVEYLKDDFTPHFSKWMKRGTDAQHPQGGCFVEQLSSELIGWFYYDYDSDVEARVEEDGTIWINVDTVWHGMAECPGYFQDYNYLIPKSPCEESYSFRYVLGQACEPANDCRLSGGRSSANTGSLEVTYVTTPIECECKD